ncbi:hypothetical protein TcCL_Unassigned04045 [Trypanosoma cruzi]|uniref:Uncharacterized protein n=1 Tax=Trypanosoma cruzi (strain CL Brener) TaxID=353153 RepID=Q4DXA1_TRYCC|nr:uncharacterized protein Tc00.1047053506067.270 [Trypanosoma cruzi]EAN97158.1 hypothetical protein Tc00.1047053506067.270 [Trypanosoma cruzi]RNC33277.1 hypothetical protein TcCL_Unassigned04045 [Trypanosoma cruzi]|eukprot:XP_819009.1 hypothetical protein Tc00.1047053506067.270 [Trypanosoma cruzi strain CL Brener]
MILNYGQTFLPLSPSSHLDPLHYCMAPPRQMISLWRSIVQQLAGSHPHIERSALPLKMALYISYLFVWKHPNRPHESWWQRTPCWQSHHTHHHNQKHQQQCRPWVNVTNWRMLYVKESN